MLLGQGNRLGFPEGYRKYLSWAQELGHSSRYAGATLADVHRILLQGGGVFMYPPTTVIDRGSPRVAATCGAEVYSSVLSGLAFWEPCANGR